MCYTGKQYIKGDVSVIKKGDWLLGENNDDIFDQDKITSYFVAGVNGDGEQEVVLDYITWDQAIAIINHHQHYVSLSIDNWLSGAPEDTEVAEEDEETSEDNPVELSLEECDLHRPVEEELKPGY